MTERHLHIVTHDVPWPADYGGVIDIFYKIKELHNNGVLIHLHCFTKNKLQQNELDKYCVSVNYYSRKKHFSGFSLATPYIVNSRQSDQLMADLLKDDYPILLEGIHCTHILKKLSPHNRPIIIRLHNVEHEYYKHLAKYENNFFKKAYFLYESLLLKKYENKLAKKYKFWTVSRADEEFYSNRLKAKQIKYLPVFLPWTKLNCKEGNGCFCLYHANLSINENEKAALWLLQNVFNDLQIPFVIAGKNPSKKLEKMAHLHAHTCLVSNPSESEMMDLIAKAQINILPSFNSTGIKLKLLFSLFNGRHCIVNTAGVAGSGLENLCHIANTVSEYKQLIQQLFYQLFTEEECKIRQTALTHLYNNEQNVQEIIHTFWPA